jgi:uncharacterized protein (DUF2267 family)
MIEMELSERLDVDSSRATNILEAVGAIIAQSVSPGQIQDVCDQLPEDLRSVFSDLVSVNS